jgi:hypothetical protein
MNKELEENIRMISAIATYLEDRDESPLAAEDMLKLISIISKHDVLIAEREALIEELKKAKQALIILRNYNSVHNDLESYLYGVADWGLGEIDREPSPEHYGL